MESDPDPDGQGLPLGFLAGLQEFFNILHNASEFLPGRNGLPTWPTCWANWVSVPGYTCPLGPLGGPGGGRVFERADFLENFIKNGESLRGPPRTARGDPGPRDRAPESKEFLGIPCSVHGPRESLVFPREYVVFPGDFPVLPHRVFTRSLHPGRGTCAGGSYEPPSARPPHGSSTRAGTPRRRGSADPPPPPWVGPAPPPPPGER